MRADPHLLTKYILPRRSSKLFFIVSVALVVILTTTYVRHTYVVYFYSSPPQLINIFQIPKFPESRQQPQNQDPDTNPFLNLTASKWVVVAGSGPSHKIRKLSQINGWKILILAENGTLQTWELSQSNSILLNASTQSRLPYRIIQYLPNNVYKRKVIGYLFAIEHGAKFIVDMDEHSIPDDPAGVLSGFVFSPTSRGLILRSYNETVINPYAHFGQRSAWPRGFPLKFVGQVQPNFYTACPMHTPLIQQALVNGEPDLDAIFHLTRPKPYAPLNMEFDGHAPPLICPESVLAPLSSQNTFFHYDAFWALLIPVSVEDRVADIWRGYWAQPLLWRLGGHVGFNPPRSNSTQGSPTPAYLQQFGEETKLYKQAGSLVELLATWKCTENTLYECMASLTGVMANKGMWSSDEIQLLKAWIEDLKAVGYVEPRFQERSTCLDGASQSDVIFNAVTMETTVIDRHRVELREFCNFTITSPSPLPTTNSSVPAPRLEYPDTLLVVIFNNPFFENIWVLDLIYRPHYPNILYCGNTGNSTAEIYTGLFKSPAMAHAKVPQFSLLNGPDIGFGSFTYDCALRAIDMSYGVSGYLVVQDDSLMNFWNYGHFDPDEMWIEELKGKKVLRTDLPVNSTGWTWWGSVWGINATRRALELMYGANQSVAVQDFVGRREEWGYNSTTAVVCQADAFYFPASRQEQVYEVGIILRECKVYLELSIPILVTGLSAPERIVDMKGHNLYRELRDRPFDYIDPALSILHPVKISQVIRDSFLRHEYCNKYVGQILKRP